MEERKKNEERRKNTLFYLIKFLKNDFFLFLFFIFIFIFKT